jgi:subtilisin family serine protease
MSTYPSSLGHQYVKMKGTSMATPHVAGLAALLLSKNPSMTPAALKAKIMAPSINCLHSLERQYPADGLIFIKRLAVAGPHPVLFRFPV